MMFQNCVEQENLFIFWYFISLKIFLIKIYIYIWKNE